MSNKTLAACYLIRCFTNTHVGSGDDNYGTIDKLIQRDPITHYPEFHSSSIKGSLREYFEEEIGWVKDGDDIRIVFGSEKADGGNEQAPTKQKSAGEPKKSGNGQFKFMDAKLLALPKWSNKAPYYLVTSKDLIDEFKNLCAILGSLVDLPDKFPSPFPGTELSATGDQANILIDEEVATSVNIQTDKELTDALGNNLAFAPTELMKQFSKNLPVVARNKLGVNNNLWYEEVLPRQTLLYWFICYSEKNKALFETFNNKLHNSTVQIGANASIGYGACHFTLISKQP